MTEPAQSIAEAGSKVAAGLECRKCGCRHLPVDHTRRANGMIIRYRRCRHCGARTTTCERVVGRSS